MTGPPWRTKQLVFDLIWDLDIAIWNLFEIWCLQFVISGLSGLGSKEASSSIKLADLQAGG
jgi:hypothetical protein